MQNTCVLYSCYHSEFRKGKHFPCARVQVQVRRSILHDTNVPAVGAEPVRGLHAKFPQLLQAKLHFCVLRVTV